MVLEAVRLKGHVQEDGKLVVTEKLTEVPAGEVELLVLYTKSEAPKPRRFKLTSLDLGEFRGTNLSREEIYDDAR
jgi:hypothetical protein